MFSFKTDDRSKPFTLPLTILEVGQWVPPLGGMEVPPKIGTSRIRYPKLGCSKDPERARVQL